MADGARGSRVAGSLYGLAYGDAMGAPTEFWSMEQIERAYGPDGPRELPHPARVTDDTQLALAVADALLAGGEDGHTLTPQRFEPRLRGRFLWWYTSSDNDRAPGRTCLEACARMADGLPWLEASIPGSKGCGANMRVTPVALAPGLSTDQRAGAAQLQAALTHGHPTALAASELTMTAVLLLLDGLDPADLPAALHEHCHAQRDTYRHEWLGELWSRAHDPDPGHFITRGWNETLAALGRLDAALAHPDRRADPCQATGAGWIAEEALATALLCFLLYPDNPVTALGRAAATSGDSDSIACLTGALAGATHGIDGWPTEWAHRIEYDSELARISTAWA